MENSNSSVSYDGQKLAQLIGNRQKLETETTSEIFSRQIVQNFSANKVHNRTVPLCPCNSDTETIGSIVRFGWHSVTDWVALTPESSQPKFDCHD